MPVVNRFEQRNRSSARLALVKAKEPEMKQKTAIANFVPDFMSFLDRENGIIFHEKDSVIQRFSMQLEKELKATVQIPVDAIFESDDNNEEIIIFSKKSGFFSKSPKNALRRVFNFQNGVGISKSPLSRENVFFISSIDNIVKIENWRETNVFQESGGKKIGQVVALSNDELVFVRGENDLVKLSNGKVAVISRQDGPEEPCRRGDDFRRLNSEPRLKRNRKSSFRKLKTENKIFINPCGETDQLIVHLLLRSATCLALSALLPKLP